MTMQKRGDRQFNFRLPDELKKRIEDAAMDNNRSQNAEVTSRLSRSFMDDDRLRRIEMKMDMLLHLYPMLSGGEPDKGGLQTTMGVIAAYEITDEDFKP